MFCCVYAPHFLYPFNCGGHLGHSRCRGVTGVLGGGDTWVTASAGGDGVTWLAGDTAGVTCGARLLSYNQPEQISSRPSCPSLPLGPCMGTTLCPKSPVSLSPTGLRCPPLVASCACGPWWGTVTEWRGPCPTARPRTGRSPPPRSQPPLQTGAVFPGQGEGAVRSEARPGAPAVCWQLLARARALPPEPRPPPGPRDELCGLSPEKMRRACRVVRPLEL